MIRSIPSNLVRLPAALLCCALAACSSAPGAPVPSVSGGTAANRFIRELPNASSYKLLYSFGRKSNDGYAPVADLAASGGALYGTTEFGGTTSARCSIGCGTIFRVTASGATTVTYRFKGGNDGVAPIGALVALNGAFFGTTSSGGSGHGTVFEVSSDGKSEKVIYRFKGGSDGSLPAAGLVALNGTLYGTTQYGGKRSRVCFKGCGTVFSVGTSGTESVLYAFKGGADGELPDAALAAVGGALYGTTQYGGRSTSLCATGCGTIFDVQTDGTKKTIYSFQYTPSSGDGAYPAAGVIDVSGSLFGTTIAGGAYGDGAVFSVNESSGAERVLHSFSCCATNRDGQYPDSRLIDDGGTIYGTTRNGGTANLGVLFAMTPSGNESVLYSFAGKPDGGIPNAGLTELGGALYGTTSTGGASSEGTVFKLSP